MLRFFLTLLLLSSITQEGFTQVVNSGRQRRLIEEAAQREAMKWKDVYVDSPLYVGIVNRVKMKEFNTGDYVIGNDLAVSSTDVSDEFNVTVTTPGKMNIALRDRITGRDVYMYHYNVKRLPADEINEPRLIFGDSINHTIDTSSLRKMKKIMVTNGFNFVSATVYFTIPGSSYVLTSGFKDWSTPFIDSVVRLCTTGSTIIFDNVKVSDSKGREYIIVNPGVSVTNAPSNMAIFDALNELYELLNKEYRSGTIYVAVQPHTNAEVVAAKDSRSPRTANIIAMCSPGSVITFENCVYLNKETGKVVMVNKAVKL